MISPQVVKDLIEMWRAEFDSWFARTKAAVDMYTEDSKKYCDTDEQVKAAWEMFRETITPGRKPVWPQYRYQMRLMARRRAYDLETERLTREVEIERAEWEQANRGGQYGPGSPGWERAKALIGIAERAKHERHKDATVGGCGGRVGGGSGKADRTSEGQRERLRAAAMAQHAPARSEQETPGQGGSPEPPEAAAPIADVPEEEIPF